MGYVMNENVINKKKLLVKIHFHSRDGNVSSEVLGDDTLYDCGVGKGIVMVDVSVSTV